ncbi:hypothetical protein [Williamsia phyllosphaerae]|uniref:Mce-associated membrane protein n=1 Tax=Williamsia phyllosphaerae TaxID=885042 RepID=A0ABQ1UP14_9NOCA|nr:hypothetical protein [Williamsia phyllosphaerae]GGF23365.1 hypothetical protein GCM10007298_19140 [Williamsia phyllosphaerae]
MTTPRPPRSNPPRRTPKVAGRIPARPVTPPASETAPEQTTPEQTTPEQTPPEQTSPPRKSRFSRKPKSEQPTAAETTPVVTPPVDTPAEDTAPVETPAEDAPAAERSADPTDDTTPDDSAAVDTAADAAAVIETPTQGEPTTTEADTEPVAATEPATTSLEKAAGDGPRGKNRPTTKVSTLKPQSTRPTAPAPVPASESRKAPRGPLLGWKLVGIVTAAAVVFAIVAGIAALRPGVSLSSNEAFVNSSVTSEVTSQANSRICTIFGVQYDKLDQWQQTAQANVTGTAAQRFAEYDKAVRDALGQAGLTTGGVDCRVDSVGVRSIEGDNATLVVNLILSQTQGQQASGSGTKRYQVSMQQVGGKWLVSNFADF